MSSRTLSPRLAYGLVAAVIGLALFASGTPSPLYATYRELWGFSSLVLTLIYATYAFGVLAVAGARRPHQRSMGPAAGAAGGARHAAGDVGPVHARRRRSRGCSSRAASRASPRASRSAPPRAAMLDLHPRRDPAGVGLANGVVSAGGMGLGVLVSSLLVQFAPAPRVLPYVALLVLFAIAFVGALLMPEPVAERSRPRLTPQRPSIPAVVRRPFLLAALAVISSWSSAGCSCRSARRSRRRCSRPPTTSWPGSASSRSPARAPSRSCSSAARRHGRARPTASLALALGMVLIVLSAASDSAAAVLGRAR